MADNLSEASGIALSARNPGVLWAHNDGSREKLFALSTNGALLASFNLRRSVADVEGVAVGPGPVKGVSYLYVGDIGGDTATGTSRDRVHVLRVPEPLVEPNWAGDPKSGDFEQVEGFILRYPDGSYDAEALMVDPLSGDVLIATKQPTGTRVYRASLTGATNNATLVSELVGSVPFAEVSAGDISADGRQLALRREEFAWIWARCDSEPIADALARSGRQIPVVGPPEEPNGEAIAFLREGLGYLTVSEGEYPPLHFYQSSCPLAPRFLLAMTNQSGFAGGSVQLTALAVGYPSPAYQWRFNGQPLAGATTASLTLSPLAATHAGQYQVIASNEHGSATNTLTLTVRPKPDLRITEVQSSTAPSPNVPSADWWELTSFESQPVDLSGWRFNDSGGGLTDAFVFGVGLVIAPGESIVFVEGLTPLQFRAWWGIYNVPTSTQIISYSGSGLSFGAGGDGVRLWSPLASDPVALVNFGAAANGVTFNYDPVTGQFGVPSQVGVNGIIRAAAAADIGSPGRILAPASSPVLRAVGANGRLEIEFDAAVGRRYSLEGRNDWNGGTWIPTGDVLLATNNASALFGSDCAAANRFYRVLVE